MKTTKVPLNHKRVIYNCQICKMLPFFNDNDEKLERHLQKIGKIAKGGGAHLTE